MTVRPRSSVTGKYFSNYPKKTNYCSEEESPLAITAPKPMAWGMKKRSTDSKITTSPLDKGIEKVLASRLDRVTCSEFHFPPQKTQRERL